MARQKHVKMTGGADQVGSRVAHPIVYPDIALRPKGELIAPVLSFALVAGNPLILEFAEGLDGDFVPDTGSFDIQKNAGSAAVTSLVVVGTTVKLTMTVAIVQGDTLTVAYTRPTANTRLRDLRGNEVASFTATTVLNYTPGAADTTVPALALATVQGANMVLYIDEQLDPASVPAVTDFAVVIGGSADVVTVVAINGNVVRLTLTTAATYGQSATVAYTAPGANMLQDLAGNDVATFGATTALNYTGTTPDTQAPRHSFFLVNTTTITIGNDEQLDTGFTPATTAYSVVVNGAAGVNPSAVSVNGSAVRLTITAVVSTDTVTVAYTQPGANQLRDIAGNLAASFTAQSCINVTDRAIGATPTTQAFDDAAAAGSNVTGAAADHLHGMPPASASYDAITTAARLIAFWDDFTGRVATVASSERYVASAGAGATTPTFQVDATTGQTKLRAGVGVNLAGELTTFTFSTLDVRAAEDWGFKCVINETTAPTIGAGDIFYLVGFLESASVSTDDGIYFRSQDSGNWFLVCRDAGAETTRDLGVGPDTTTNRLLEFRITGDGTSVQAYVDNVATGAAITTNIPTNLLAEVGILVICDVDITTAGEVALRGMGVRSGF